MSNSVYTACKGLAYQVLATVASCDHPKAQSKGYKDGWEMLMDKHDDNEMALFCMSLGNAMSIEQSTVLLDGLAREYSEFTNWGDFTKACCEYPDWKPSRGNLADYVSRQNANNP